MYATMFSLYSQRVSIRNGIAEPYNQARATQFAIVRPDRNVEFLMNDGVRKYYAVARRFDLSQCRAQQLSRFMRHVGSAFQGVLKRALVVGPGGHGHMQLDAPIGPRGAPELSIQNARFAAPDTVIELLLR